MKVALDDPVVTLTVAGTVAAALSLLSAILTPPVGAGPLSVTVPVEPVPPITLVGFKLKELKAAAGETVNNAVCDAPPKVAVIVTLVEADTEDVVMVKVVPVLPAGTVTDEGTVAAGLLLLSATATPPAGTGALKVTVPVEFAPPITLAGFKLSEFNISVSIAVVKTTSAQ